MAFPQADLLQWRSRGDGDVPPLMRVERPSLSCGFGRSLGATGTGAVTAFAFCSIPRSHRAAAPLADGHGGRRRGGGSELAYGVAQYCDVQIARQVVGEL